MNEFNGDGHAEDSAKSDSYFSEITTDGIFSVKVSEDMRIRNVLRNGLVEAQGKDGEKIPMFVSWPHWLDDGIVCMFARDLHAVLADTVRNTVVTINKDLEYSDNGETTGIGSQEDEDGILSDMDVFAQEAGSKDSLRNELEHGKDQKVAISGSANTSSIRSKIIKANKIKL